MSGVPYAYWGQQSSGDRHGRWEGVETELALCALLVPLGPLQNLVDWIKPNLLGASETVLQASPRNGPGNDIQLPRSTYMLS
jgi:hypothetical protein